MKANTYAYVRVSSKDQNEARQVSEIMKHGVNKNNIIIEKASGKNFNRSKYKQMINNIKEGDTLYISSVDRLGRNYDEILNEWHRLTKDIKIFIKVLDMPILNTDRKTDTLIDRFIRDMTLLSSAFQAEQEWQNIRVRQKAGINTAKEKGQRFGRPKIEPSEKDIAIITEWTNGLLSANEAMSKLKKKKSAFYRLVKDLKK